MIFGLELEVWKTYKHHVMDPDGDLRPRFIPIIDDPIGVPAMDIDHCPFIASDHKPALDAVVNQFIVITPHPGSLEEGQAPMEERVEEYAKDLDSRAPRRPCVWGESIEKPGTWVIAVGWDHTKASTDPVQFEQNLDKDDLLNVSHRIA